MSCPPTRRPPDVAWSSPPSRLSSVDFPEPDLPSSATRSPRATSSVTPRRAIHGRGGRAVCLGQFNRPDGDSRIHRMRQGRHVSRLRSTNSTSVACTAHDSTHAGSRKRAADQGMMAESWATGRNITVKSAEVTGGRACFCPKGRRNNMLMLVTQNPFSKNLDFARWLASRAARSISRPASAGTGRIAGWNSETIRLRSWCFRFQA